MQIPIGCTKCMACRKKKAREWSVRMQEELRNTELKGYFMTMTFSEESLIELDNDLKNKGMLFDGYELDNRIASLAVRRFTERWRKKHGKSVRHWLITELGGNNTERLHIHGIIWTNEDKQDIIDLWNYGRCDTGKYVNERSVGYIVKYLSKVDKKHKEYVPKMFVSNGIGKGYLDRIDSNHNVYKKDGKTFEEYITRQGSKMAMPIYYRNKLYSEKERELLWLEKLDKEELWCNGVKFDISKDMDAYNKRLEQEQKLNLWLGYGDDNINWEVRRYERDRRNLKKQKRLQKQWSKEKALRSDSSPEGQDLVG